MILSVVMILFVLFELIKINIFRNDNNILLAGFISLLLFGFGFYLLIKYGLILDYGTADEIKSTHAEIMASFATTSVLTGLGSTLISILKVVVWKIKKALSNE